MGKLFPSILMFVCCFTSWSQEEQYRFKNVGIDRGLSQNSVISIAQDSLGFMWFATQDGLNRYDGYEFKIFPVSFDDITNPDNTILGKLLIHENELWMITKGGNLEVMDLTKEIITQKSHFGSSGKELPVIRSLFIENSNRIWLGTENEGVYIVDSNLNILHHLSRTSAAGFKISANRINKIFKDSRENFWILTNRGMNKFSEGRLSEVYLKNLNTSSIAEDAAGTLFAGTYGQGLYAKEVGDFSFHSVEEEGEKDLPKNLIIESLEFDLEGNLWIGTYGDGVYLLNEHMKISHFVPERDRPNSIGFQDILALERDQTGGIWIGTDGGGVSFFHQSFRNFKQFDQTDVSEEIAIEQIRAIETDDEGRLFLGTSGNGLTVYSSINNEFETIHFKPHKPSVKNHDRVLSLHHDDVQNTLWVGTHGNGTILMDNDSGEIIRWFTADAEKEQLRLPSNSVNCFLEAKNRRVWAGSRGAGLLLIDPDKGLLRRYCAGDSNDHEITALAQVDDSALAMGHKKRGVKILNIQNGEIRPILQDFIAANVGEVEVKSLYYFNEWLWVGTAGKGFITTNLKTGRTKLFSKKDGLPNDMIYSIVAEDSNTLWMSSNSGLFRLIYKIENGDVAIDRITSFTQENGLQSNEFNTGAYHKAKDGTLYFGGIKGVNYFDPEEIPGRREDLKVVISEAMVDNVPIESPHNITYTSHLNLPYDQNSVAFAYTALNFVSPEQFNYSYKMEGYDENWIRAGSRKYTAYTNLPSGDYVFKVKLSENTLKEAPVTELGISIATPFWRTWWFLLFVTFSFSGFLYLIYRDRVSQLLRLQQVKDNISADLHDDLGSRLTTIHLLSAIARPGLKDNSETTKVLEKIDREIYASSEALDEIVWNIRISDENLSDIIAKIRRYVSEVLENNNLQYHIEAEHDFDSFSMGMQKRRELFLMCKELINNVRKHANATRVEMIISRAKDRLYICVKDNGQGFDPVVQTDRSGIVNLRSRIKKWNGEFNIESKCQKGTKIEIWIPFDKPGVLHKMMNYTGFRKKI